MMTGEWKEKVHVKTERKVKQTDWEYQSLIFYDEYLSRYYHKLWLLCVSFVHGARVYLLFCLILLLAHMKSMQKIWRRVYCCKTRIHHNVISESIAQEVERESAERLLSMRRVQPNQIEYVCACKFNGGTIVSFHNVVSLQIPIIHWANRWEDSNAIAYNSHFIFSWWDSSSWGSNDDGLEIELWKIEWEASVPLNTNSYSLHIIIF